MSVRADQETGWGKAAPAFASRPGYPARLLEELSARDIGVLGQSVLDLATGTGIAARAMAARGCRVIAIDASEQMIAAAIESTPAPIGAPIDYRVGLAEDTGIEGDTIDAVTCFQALHWLNRPKVLAEAMRVLKPGCAVVVVHFDWVPCPGDVVELSESLFGEFDASEKPWQTLGARVGVYAPWFADLVASGFQEIESFTFDEVVPFSQAAWAARLRASVFRARLSDDEFDRFLGAVQAATAHLTWPAPVLHRLFCLIGRKPASGAASAHRGFSR